MTVLSTYAAILVRGNRRGNGAPREKGTREASRRRGDGGGEEEYENSPVLYTCSSSTMPSLPPPKTTMRSLIATARWPCLGLGWGPVGFAIRFHFSMGAAMMTVDHIIFSCRANVLLLLSLLLLLGNHHHQHQVIPKVARYTVDYIHRASSFITERAHRVWSLCARRRACMRVCLCIYVRGVFTGTGCADSRAAASRRCRRRRRDFILSHRYLSLSLSRSLGDSRLIGGDSGYTRKRCSPPSTA